MKILGLYAGRKRGTSEYLLKTALKEAAAMGAEVEAINLRDLKIKPCTGCTRCTVNLFTGSEKNACILKDDDMPWVDEKINECDGMIVVCPCFENSPPSEFKLLCDRMGPSHDYNFRKIAHEMRLKNGLPGLDERIFKRRPCAFIAHGGSEWTTLGPATLSILAVPLGMTIVDLLQLSWNTTLVYEEDRMAQVKEAGRAVAAALGKEIEDMEYVGKPGHCPMCHNYTMILGENANDVTCAVCGMIGTISIVDGKIKVTYDEEQYKHSHVTDSGRMIHADDLQKMGNELKKYDVSKYPEMQKEAMDWLKDTKPVRA